MSQRKIVQISASVGDAPFLNALCDDGTVWDFSFKLNRWDALPPIPQDTHPTTPTRGTHGEA